MAPPRRYAGRVAGCAFVYSVLMRAPVTREVLQDKESRASIGAVSHHQVATQLAAWATHPHDRDEVPVAEVWVAAGEQFALGGEHTHALHAYQRAAQCKVATIPDARGFVIKAFLDLGQTDQAQEASDQLRRARPATAATYHLVGETWEEAGDLSQANQWLTRGVILAERHREVADVGLLLVARLRVRDGLGFAPDDYDDIAIDILMNNAGELLQPE